MSSFMREMVPEIRYLGKGLRMEEQEDVATEAIPQIG